MQVRYQVTPEGVQQIFAEKPHVHRAFLANVPARMDENAFWTRFFKNELNRQVSCSASSTLLAGCVVIGVVLSKPALDCGHALSVCGGRPPAYSPTPTLPRNTLWC